MVGNATFKLNEPDDIKPFNRNQAKERAGIETKQETGKPKITGKSSVFNQTKVDHGAQI